MGVGFVFSDPWAAGCLGGVVAADPLTAAELELGTAVAFRVRRPGLHQRFFRSRTGLLIARLVALALLIGLWQLLYSTHSIDPLVSRSPAQVWHATVDLLGGGSNFWHHMWSTLSAMLIALVVSSVVGVLIGVGLGLLPTL